MVAQAIAEAVRFSDLAQPEARLTLMRRHTETCPGLDRRGQAAFSVNGLGYFVSEALAARDLKGRDLRLVEARSVLVVSERREKHVGGRSVAYLHQAVTVAPLPPRGPEETPAGEVAAAVEGLFEPLVAGAAAEARLAPSALWRLVADGVGAGWLAAGERVGRPEAGLVRAKAILATPDSRLANAQIGFARIEASPEQSATGEALSKWFRLRGGGCRWYTAEGGEICATCVLRRDREARLRKALVASASGG